MLDIAPLVLKANRYAALCKRPKFFPQLIVELLVPFFLQKRCDLITAVQK